MTLKNTRYAVEIQAVCIGEEGIKKAGPELKSLLIIAGNLPPI